MTATPQDESAFPLSRWTGGSAAALTMDTSDAGVSYPCARAW